MAVLDAFANATKVTTPTGYTLGATSIVLSTGHGARLTQALPFNMEWWDSSTYPLAEDDPNYEIIRVTTLVGDTCGGITRGVENTTASAKNTGTLYTLVAGLTAKTLNVDIPALVLQRPFVAKSGDYTLTLADETATMDASGAVRTFTLPTAVGCSGKRYYLKKIDASANPVVIATTSSQTIDGFTVDWLLTQYSHVELISDGANWQIVARQQRPYVVLLAATDTLVASTIGTTETPFATTFTLPANYFSAGKRVRVSYLMEDVSTGVPTLLTKFRTNAPTNLFVQSAVGAVRNGTQSNEIVFTLTGTAAPGASVAVETGWGVVVGVGQGSQNSQTQGVNLPTNGALVFQQTLTYSAGTAANSRRLRAMTVEYLN